MNLWSHLFIAFSSSSTQNYVVFVCLQRHLVLGLISQIIKVRFF